MQLTTNGTTAAATHAAPSTTTVTTDKPRRAAMRHLRRAILDASCIVVEFDDGAGRRSYHRGHAESIGPTHLRLVSDRTYNTLDIELAGIVRVHFVAAG